MSYPEHKKISDRWTIRSCLGFEVRFDNRYCTTFETREEAEQYCLDNAANYAGVYCPSCKRLTHSCDYFGSCELAGKH